MHRRDSSGAGVDQQDRNAIRCADSKTKTGDIRQEGVSFTYTSLAARQVDADVGMDLFEADDAGLPVPLPRVARAETVLQPWDIEQGSGLKDVSVIPEKSIRHRPYAAGSCVRAIRTCRLKFSSIDSSSRTSVGRLASVVILSILSWSWSSP